MISTAADGAFSVFATDVDGDGDTDVLATSCCDNRIIWYESKLITHTADFDADDDGDVDLLDFAAFQAAFTGPQ